MTKFRRLQMSLKDEQQKIVDFVRNGDAKADSLLDKIKNSNLTAVILGIGLAAVLVLILFAWLVG
jgi:hypothetical protein